jgi:hypothetical protein
VTDALVEHGDGEVVRTVAKNAGAEFSNTGFGVLVSKSSADELLAEIVAMRRDLPPDRFEKLIAAASSAVRNRLAYASPHLADKIRVILTRITAEAKEAAEKPRDYATAKNLVRALHTSKELGEAEVADFAKQGKFEETRRCGCDDLRGAAGSGRKSVPRPGYGPGCDPHQGRRILVGNRQKCPAALRRRNAAVDGGSRQRPGSFQQAASRHRAARSSILQGAPDRHDAALTIAILATRQPPASFREGACHGTLLNLR